VKLTILGSGSPEAYIRRASSGYLVDVGTDCILFDCGGGVFDNLLRAGRQPSDITHIIFTHLHSDHMMDYARMVHASWDQGGAPIKIYGPAPIGAITEGFFGVDGVLAHDLRARTELPQSQEVWLARGGTLPRPWPAPQLQEITAGDIIEGEGWRIDSATAPHAQPFLECMAYALSHAGKKFAYSGDTGLCPEVSSLAEKADLLLHWCYRLDGVEATPLMAATTPTPSEISKMAKEIEVSRLILTHFRKYMDEKILFNQALKNAREIFGENVSIAEDLQQFDI